MMAVFLVMVPAIGSLAALPFLLMFIPLLLWSALRDTEMALYVFFAWCWMDGTIRGIFGSNLIAILSRDIVLFLIAIAWGLQRRRTFLENPLRTPPGTLIVALFVMTCLVEIANPASAGTDSDPCWP